jgi:hypothetical protein
MMNDDNHVSFAESVAPHGMKQEIMHCVEDSIGLKEVCGAFKEPTIQQMQRSTEPDKCLQNETDRVNNHTRGTELISFFDLLQLSVDKHFTKQL